MPVRAFEGDDRHAPPWGSLTGIRPSRLYYEALEAGLDPVDTLTRVFDVAEEKALILKDVERMQRGTARGAPRSV